MNRLFGFLILSPTMMVFSSPIIQKKKDENERVSEKILCNLSISEPENILYDLSISEPCSLPPNFGYFLGDGRYLRDCDSVNLFEHLPLPLGFNSIVGIHPKICCPTRKHMKETICFPTDLWCPSYQAEPLTEPLLLPEPTMADQKCEGDTTCLPLSLCPALLSSAWAPATVTPCGFDEKEASLMICCPAQLRSQGPVNLRQPPRFPVEGKARPCEDQTEMCRVWGENGACALDTHFQVLQFRYPGFPESSGIVKSDVMFHFMQSACPATCGWCGDAGCVDSHPQCPQWARNNLCVLSPFVMALTCRESCGTCGFLAPDNWEQQESDGVSYTDPRSDTFHCGIYKSFQEVNGTSSLQNGDLNNRTEDRTSIDQQSSEEVDVPEAELFFSSDEESKAYCTATIISDKYMVSAAHCYDEFVSSGGQAEFLKARINTIRDNTKFRETVEIRRIFIHPLYVYPELYNDIAVLELGRRIIFDFDLIGDTPACSDLGTAGEVWAGSLATIQGVGYTEDGEVGELLETNITVITNSKCKEDMNTVTKKSIRRQMNIALPCGLNYGLMCGEGSCDGGVCRGACKGDSGGPMYGYDSRDRKTLIGITSGGIGCARKLPGWFTRVGFFSDWITCIIDRSKEVSTRREIERHCEDRARPSPPCQEVEPVFDGDLREAIESGNKCKET